ncbi:GNAT family N-acetyltransferase [Enterococcus silesiacus]|nr:GNAT family N-acetyltransferase [Enterococcus silesiacus]
MENLTTKELEEILSIWLNANKEAHSFIPASYWQENLAFVREQLPQAVLYTYSQEGKILAFLGITGTYIAGIFVISEHRQQGIGKKLLNEVKSKYNTLNLSVYAKNQKALDFYLKQDFQQVAEQVDNTGELEYQLVWEK